MNIYINKIRKPKFIDWEEIEKQGFNFVENISRAEIILERDVHNPRNELHKTVLLSHEPPLEKRYQKNYEPHFRNKFYRVYSTILNTQNSRQIAQDPYYFWMPKEGIQLLPSLNEITGNLAFFGRFGNGIDDEISKETFSEAKCSSLYPARRKVVKELIGLDNSYIFGSEWDNADLEINESPGRRNNFRKSKIGFIASNRFTYVLCLENCIMKNYFTEKFWDALSAGAIPIYLGMPDVEERLSEDYFVDARRFYNECEGELNLNDLMSYLKSISPKRALEMIQNGSEFCKSEQKNKYKNRDKLTNSIIEDLNEHRSNFSEK